TPMDQAIVLPIDQAQEAHAPGSEARIVSCEQIVAFRRATDPELIDQERAQFLQLLQGGRRRSIRTPILERLRKTSPGFAAAGQDLIIFPEIDREPVIEIAEDEIARGGIGIEPKLVAIETIGERTAQYGQQD